jgi:hypothetical protein
MIIELMREWFGVAVKSGFLTTMLRQHQSSHVSGGILVEMMWNE